MTRTDIHRPAALVTEDYNYLWAGDNSPEMGPGWVMLGGDYTLELARRLAKTDRLERGVYQCHHCGARLRYFALLEHVPTGDVIAVGETCLDNRFERSSADFHKLRKQAELDRQAMRIRTAVNAFVAENPDLAWMAEKVTPEPHASNVFLYDVARKLRLYGELSERQVEAVRKAVVRDAERAVKQAEEDALPKVPCPTGRVTITGTILSTKWVDSNYGGSLKMLVKADEGFKVWGSVPSSLNVEREDRITFTATVEQSHDDVSFGFAKRPTKARILEEAK